MWGDRKIYQQCNNVNDRRYKRTWHDRRVQFQFFCDYRQRAADELCTNNGEHQSDADYERDSCADVIYKKHFAEIAERKGKAA